MGCVSLSYHKIPEIRNKTYNLFFEDELPYDMVIPVENSRNNSAYLAHQFAEIITLKTFNFYFKEDDIKPDQQIMWLVVGTLRTIPVLFLAMIMAVCIGCVVWVMVSIFAPFLYSYILQRTLGRM